MRLTLRTLLAYLDDTLEPAEIKQIGQKVAESDAAQELIARIKQVTRKRRLTTPPLTGPGAKFDSNLIAEYLDNELSGEQVAEIEKICLESDVHLAEIASCHQILTLVLGEPALVPPTARERMYSLVKGREAIPFRKASPKNTQAVGKHSEDNLQDTSVLGLPVHKRHAAWLKWAIPVAALFLFVALGVALLSTLGGGGDRPDNRQASADKGNGDKQDSGKEGNGDKAKSDKADGDKSTADKGSGDKVSTDKTTTDKPDTDKSSTDKTTTDKPTTDKPTTDKPTTDKPNSEKPNEDEKPKVAWPERIKEPSKERHEIATYDGSPRMGVPSVLVSRPRGTDPWTRVLRNSRVSTSDTLVSLPGYSSELHTESGVHLLLWGTLPEFNQNSPTCPYLFECAVTLHANPNVDLEFTLDRGRVYLSNRKDKPTLVRVRFKKEVWDLLLQPESEILLELINRLTEHTNFLDGEEPKSDLTLVVINGAAGLKFNNYDDNHEIPNLQGPAGPSLVLWNNKGQRPAGPFKIDNPAPFFALLGKEPNGLASEKAFKDFRPALDEVSGLLVDKKAVDVTLVEGVEKGTSRTQKALCIFSLGAIDAVPNLLGILGKEDAASADERQGAVIALRRWICRGPQTAKLLYDSKADTGFLKDKGYKQGEAETLIYMLYFQLSEQTAKDKDTYEKLIPYLGHGKMAVRELAYYQLIQLTFGAKDRMPEYDPSWPAERRKKAVSEWLAFLAQGKLPPTFAPPPK